MVRISVLAALVAVLWPVAPATAQPLGTYRWQLQPYCNMLTLAVVQQGGQYQLHGVDEQCGNIQRASAVGLAYLNADGSIGFGLTIVTTPGGSPVHVEAVISMATLSGTWRDSAGNNGAFVYTPGGPVPGGRRPVPTGGIAPGSITSVHIAPGTIGAAQVNTTQIQARVSGSCPGGAISTIGANGAVTCTPADAGGPFKRGLFDLSAIPPTASSFGTAAVLATLTFTAPVTGWAIATGSGYCEGSSLTTGPTSTVLFIGAPGDPFSRFYIAPQRLQQDSAAQMHQWPWTIQRDLAIVAGTEYTIVVKGYHGEGPTAPSSCAGNVLIRAQAGYFP